MRVRYLLLDMPYQISLYIFTMCGAKMWEIQLLGQYQCCAKLVGFEANIGFDIEISRKYRYRIGIDYEIARA